MDQSTVFPRIAEMIRAHATLPCEQVEEETDLKESYGIDSIGLVELLIEIEAEYDITFDSSQLTAEFFSTPGSIAGYVLQRLEAAAS